ncbi:hypothetical protein SPRG_19482, partial [Saprolegnia parasitica CBS 223.65]
NARSKCQVGKNAPPVNNNLRPMRLHVGQYAALLTASIASLLAGSTTMHMILKPDLTIPELPADKTKL